jgi:nucleoid-associated protein YgaU
MKLRFSVPLSSNTYLKHSEVVEASEYVKDRVTPSFKKKLTVRYFDVFEAPKLESSELDISYVLQSTDRLDKLAFRFYGNSHLWWVIALKNDLDLPVVNLNAVDTIVIPNPNYVLATFG